MNKKIFKSMLAVSIIVLLVCITGISVILYGYFGTIIKNEIKGEAILISQHIDELQEYKEKADIMKHRVTLVDEDGTVLFDTKADANEMSNHADREEIKTAKKNGDAYSERYSDTIGVKTVYYAMQLDDGKILRVSQDYSTIAVLHKGVLDKLILICVTLVVVALILSRIVSKRIVEPINSIDLEDDETVEPYSEMAPLIRKINLQKKLIETQMNELKRKQDEFIAITENMSEGFLLIDALGEILSYNNSAIEILGKGSGEIPKMALELNRSRAFRQTVEEALSGRHSQHTIESELRIYSIIANPVSKKDENLGAVIMIVDMTEKEQRERLRREFTSNVSHELKTPLTTIYGVSDMMAEGIVKAEDIKKFSSDIKDESARMITLIDDIIKLSRLDESDATSDFTEFNLLDITTDVCESLKFKAENKGVDLTLEGYDIIMKSVPSLCYEILYNLCDNAIKYNRADGSVNVTISEDGDDAKIRVEDTGIGIDYEDRDRIFERFYRGDKSRCQDIDGTGLGLSIVKHSIQQLKGSIDVTSIPGKGTCMIVRLPK